MKSQSSFSLIAVILLFAILPANGQGISKPSGWYRGNTHTHAKYSDDNDKDDVPEIAGWYRDAGYDFMLLSEHNDHLKKKKTICHDDLTKPGKFLMFCGLELSKKKHHTAFGIDRYIGDEKSLQDGVNKTLEAGGVPILNHPKDSEITLKMFLAVKGLNHLEVFNGNRPEETKYVEMLWDSILSSPGGRRVFAVAADDNHYKKSNVGRGWVMVKADELTKDKIKNSIRDGNFYASTGVILKTVDAKSSTYSVESLNGSTIIFIGKNGKVLQKTEGKAASYTLKKDDLYVRAKIEGQDGKYAWTQPVFR